MPFKNPHPLYNVWRSMKDRCLNPKNRSWNSYGGRGITVCEKWLNDFHAFADDMGPRPENFSLDRIDNDQGYSPENCRWASRKQQQRNRRGAVYVTIEGRKHRAIELAEKSGVKADTIISRARRGLPYEDVVSPEKLHNLSGLALGGKANGKRQKQKTHCPHGHEYTDENTITNKHGWRRCRTCWNAKEKGRRERKKTSSCFFGGFAPSCRDGYD